MVHNTSDVFHITIPDDSQKPSDKKRPKVLKATSKYFREFATNTSIQGFRFIVDDQSSLPQKLWWIIVFCVCIFLCITMILSTWKKWKDEPVFLSIGQSPMRQWEIPFPAVTVCPENKIIRSKYNVTYYENLYKRGNMTKEELQHYADVTYFCRGSPESYMFNSHNLSIDSLHFIKNNSFKLSGAVSFCLWMGRDLKMCNDLLSPIFTREGLCFSFNMLDKSELFTNDSYIFEDHIKHLKTSYWNFDNNYLKTKEIGYPFRSTKMTDSLKINIMTVLEDIDRKCDSFTGYKISAHHPAELPSKFSKIDFNKSFNIAIKPKATITSEGLKKYNAHRRKCFYSNERPLKFFKIYTEQNCETECLANFTLNRCGCSPFYMPHDNSTPICGYSKFVCVARAREELLDMEMILEVSDTDLSLSYCECLPSCTLVKYSLEINTEETHNGLKNPLYAGRVVFTYLTFHFKDESLVPLTRNELFGDTNLWANFGGLLGLFTGFSVISFFEIVYYLSLRWMCQLYTSRKKARKVDSSQGI